MGRLDRARGYRPDHRLQRRDVCDAKDACQQESTEGADRGERGDEWGELF